MRTIYMPICSVLVFLIASGCAGNKKYNSPVPLPAERIAFTLLNKIKKDGKNIKIALAPIEDTDFGITIGSEELFTTILQVSKRNIFKSLTVNRLTEENYSRQNYIVVGEVREKNFKSLEKFYYITFKVIDKAGKSVMELNFWTNYLDRQPAPGLPEDSPIELEAEPALRNISEKKNILFLATIADADKFYKKGDYLKSLGKYQKALRFAKQGKSSIKVYAGLYQSNLKLNRLDNAAAAYGKLIALAIPRGKFSPKFYFEINTDKFNDSLRTDFPLWIKEIRKYFSSNDYCFYIIGFASNTGSCKHNLYLSKKRAKTIQLKLSLDENRVKSYGKGFTEADGERGEEFLLDRRVEFKIKKCPLQPPHRVRCN